MDSAKYELRRVWTEPSENAVGKVRKSSVYLVGNIEIISHLHPVNLGCISWNVSFTYLSPLVDQRYTGFIPFHWILKSIKSKNKDYFPLPPKFEISTSASLSCSSVQNMEDSWELVTVPSEIQRSTVGKQSPSDGSETSLEKNEENSKSKVCEKLEMQESSFMIRALIVLRFPNEQAMGDLINFLDISRLFSAKP